MSAEHFRFTVVPGDVVHEIVRSDLPGIVELVAETYRTHAAGQTINPNSHFLRFPERPNARIIALPAHIGGNGAVSGIKWIASFPDNIEHGIPRASAVLLLNDPETGYPYACLESSIISATRTAASAVLGAEHLTAGTRRARSIGFVGAGLIARYIFDFMAGTGWSAESVVIHDLAADYARRFADHVTTAGWPSPTLAGSVAELIDACDLIVFATTAATPHVHDPSLFAHNPRVLHISLRDLSPDIILAAENIVDDIDHCLTANTSPHLAEQQVGHRDFIAGTIADLIDGRIAPGSGRPIIYSPFGMGILDLAVGKYVHDRAVAAGTDHPVPDFFFERKRW